MPTARDQRWRRPGFAIAGWRAICHGAACPGTLPSGVMIALAAMIVLAVVLVLVLARDVVQHTALGVTDAHGEQLARDFINFWSGARLAAAGEAARVYDHGFFHQFQQSLVGPASEFKIYSYPPSMLLLTLPLAPLPFPVALALWWGLGAALVALLLSRFVGWPLAAVLAIGSPAAFIDQFSGQNGHFTAILCAGGLLLLERRPVLAGMLLGALCYKPQLGLLLPVALAAGGYWRSFAAAAATVLGLVGISIVAFGLDSWIAFLHQMPVQRTIVEMGVGAADWPVFADPNASPQAVALRIGQIWHRMPAIFTAVRWFGLSPAIAYVAQTVSTLAAAGIIIVIWRSRADLLLKGSALAIAIFLATPYAFDYDTVILLFAALWLAHAAGRRGALPGEELIIVALLFLPLLILLMPVKLQIGPFVLWPALLVVLRRCLVLSAPVLAAGA